MKRFSTSVFSYVVAAVVVAVAGMPTQPVSAAPLFSTMEDWTGWTGNNSGTASAASDLDGGTVNGLGNTSAAGGAGTAGGLSISIAGTFNQTYSPGEQGNAPFIDLMRTLSDIDAPTVAVDLIPPTGVTSYFQPLLHFNYDGFWGGLAPVSTVDNGTYTTVTYNLNSLTIPATLSYFQIGITSNSGGDEVGKTITVDNMRTLAIPEPTGAAMLSMSALTLVGTCRRRR